MNLSGQILFACGMPQIAPVVGASVRILKSLPGIAETPVSAAPAITDGSGNFTLNNCNVNLVASQTLAVPGFATTIPAGWINLPAATITVDAQTVTVPDFKVTVTGPTIDLPSGKIGRISWGGGTQKAPDFDWLISGHTFTLDGITASVPAQTVPSTPTNFNVPASTASLAVTLPGALIIEISIAGQVFRRLYPMPAGLTVIGTPPPIILLNNLSNFDPNSISGKNPFVDAFHRVAIAAQARTYAWASAAGLPAHLLRIPATELPPTAYRKRAGKDPLAFANEALAGSQPPNDPLTLPDFDKLAPLIALAGTVPAGSDALSDDLAFAAQRVAGVNPLVITRLNGSSAVPASFLNAGFGAVFQSRFGMPLATAAAAGQLYLCDYSLLAGLNPGGPRFFLAPTALFFHGGAVTDALRPAGIFLGGSFDPVVNRIYTPADATMWHTAKLVVQCADLNLHEMKSHLHDTHLVMEATAVAVHRSLFWGHPIAELLRQHFHIMFFQGLAARDYLMGAGNTVDSALGTGLNGSWNIVKLARARWSFAGAALEHDLAQRNMANAPLLYPYRDDARLILAAITRFVTSYVNAFYLQDGDVAGDTELQNWRTEMADPAKGNLGVIPALQTRADLIALVAQIIFTCSAQHSAVNYPQYDYFGRVTNMPAAIWKDPLSMRATGTPPTSPPITLLLPSKANAVAQVGLAYQLSDYRYDRLGDYRDHETGTQSYNWLHTPAQQAANAFKADLAALQTQMQLSSATRSALLRYPYLLPANILNSISI